MAINEKKLSNFMKNIICRLDDIEENCAKYKHTTVKTLPSSLERMTIYFVVSTGQIVKVDANGEHNYFGLLPSYDDAITPLSDDSKILINQNGIWRWVNKNELIVNIPEHKTINGESIIGSGNIEISAEKQLFEYYWSYGNFYIVPNYYYISHSDSGITSTVMTKISASSDIEVLNLSSTRGHLIGKKDMVLTRLLGYIRVGYGEDVRLIIGIKRKIPFNTNSIIHVASITLTNNSYWNIPINSGYKTAIGDEIVLILDARNISGNRKILQFYTKVIFS